MVILIKYYEMDDEGPRTKRGGLFRRMFWGSTWSASATDPRRQSTPTLSPPRERRPLRSVPSIGPQFKVDPEVLVKEYVEKETKYLGTIDDTKHDFDASNRSLILSLIDEKRKVGQLPWQLTYKNDVILNFSVQNIKISWRDGEQLIHRIPTHKVAATGYVQDNKDTFLFIKFASELNSEMCNISFFACESRTVAQEMCSLTQQLFQLVYTESTMDFFDKSIQDGAVTPKHHSYSTDDSDKRNTIRLNTSVKEERVLTVEATPRHPVMSNGNSHAETKEHDASNSSYSHSSAPSSMHRRDGTRLMRSNSGNGVSSPISSSSTPSSPAIARKPRRSESSSGSYSHIVSHQIQLKEYIAVLKERLTSEELNQFAQHLHHFRTGGMPIEKFCEHLMSIYKEPRKSLLLGMRHFIPEPNDRTYFETFLKQHEVGTIPEEQKRWWDRTPDSRTTSETEESSAQSAAPPFENFAEISSNSGHNSSHSHNDSDEWETMRGSVQRMNLSDTEDYSSTLKHGQVDHSTTSRGVVIGTEEGDSPVLRSGEDTLLPPPRSPTPVYVRRTETAFEKRKVAKKKSRSKSPSPAELGAPFPSIAVTGTDDDLDDHNQNVKKPKKKSREKKLGAEDKESKKGKKFKNPKLRLTMAPKAAANEGGEEPSTSKPSSPSPDAFTQGHHRKSPEHRKKKRHKHDSNEDGLVTQF